MYLLVHFSFNDKLKLTVLNTEQLHLHTQSVFNAYFMYMYNLTLQLHNQMYLYTVELPYN